MSDQRNFSRRGFLKGVGIAAGAAVGTRLGGKEWLQEAKAQAAQRTVVISVYLNGGYNALFGSAASFLNTAFGVNDGNVMQTAGGLMIERQRFGDLLPAVWRNRMTTLPNRHGSTDHGTGQRMNFGDGNRNYALQLASAIGGSAPFKAVALGDMPPAPAPAENGVSLQLLRTVTDAETILTGGRPDETIPARNVAAEGLTRANAIAEPIISKNAKSLVAYRDGYSTQIAALKKVVVPFNMAQAITAYGQGVTANSGLGGNSRANMTAKMLAAEVMIRAGANYIFMNNGGWDTHGDRSGDNVRGMMGDRIIPPMAALMNRIDADEELSAMNIIFMIHGDFARSLPGSDHANATAVTVMGKNVKGGVIRNMTAGVSYAQGTAGPQGMWAYLADIAKVSTPNLFGIANPYKENVL